MPLVTLEDYRNYTGSHREDDLHQVFIKSAENILKEYLGYYPVETEYQGVFNGRGTLLIQLNARPVTLHAVRISGVEISLGEFVVNNEFIYYQNKIFPEGLVNVEIDYTGGFPEDEIPNLLKITVLRLAALLETEAGMNIGVTSKSFADSGTRTFVNNTDYNRYLLPVSSYRLLRF
jgi:hypothetical protein